MSPLDAPPIPDAFARPAPARRPALLAELRPRPVPQRRRRLALVAAAATALALAAVLVPTLRDGGGAPALAVTRSGDWLELRIQDAGASGAELTRELRDAGVDGEVRVIPVPTEMVGTWVVIQESSKKQGVPDFDAPPVEETVRLSTIEFGREVLRLPIAKVRESSGHFILWAGREAQPGEDVAANRTAFDQWWRDLYAREHPPALKTP
jgi:hypothetical protein